MLRMPLYFVLSGLFFKEYGGYVRLLVKKVNKLLIPFIFFYLGSYLIYDVGALLLPNMASERAYLLDVFCSSYLHNNSLWFLLALFWQHLIFGAIVKTSKKWQVQVLLVAIVSGAGWALGHYEIFIPCFIVQGMGAMPFFYFGYLLKRTPILYPNKYDRYNIAFAAVLIGVALAVYYLCGCQGIGFNDNRLPHLWLVVMCGCASVVVATLLICKMIKRIPVVSYVGRYSIIVLCIHSPINMALAPMLGKVGFSFPFSTFIVVFLISLCLIPLFVRFLPWFVAQKDLIPMPQTPKAS